MLDETMIKMLLEGIRDTCYMTIVSTFFGYLIGLPLGIALTLTDEGGIAPNRTVYRILDVIINITRSIPFLILLILVMPLTKAIVGKTYGSTATIVPLTLAAAPFIGRMVESSLKEVPAGVIEAALSMGAKTGTIACGRCSLEKPEPLCWWGLPSSLAPCWATPPWRGSLAAAVWGTLPSATATTAMIPGLCW